MKELPIWLNKNKNLDHLSWYIDELKINNPDFFDFIEKEVNINILNDPKKSNNFQICFEKFGKLTYHNFELLNFFYYSILPILPSNNPLKKLFNNPKISYFLSKKKKKKKGYNKYNIIENSIDPSAKTYFISSDNVTFTKNISFNKLKKSKNPDVLIIEGDNFPKGISPIKQQILITENFYSWEKIAPLGKINSEIINILIEEPLKIFTSLTKISKIIKKINIPYILRRLPLSYNSIIEDIVEKIGFPPSSSFNLKSELLTDNYFVIWNL